MTDIKQVAQEFGTFMCQHFNTKIEPKETSEIMKATALGMDLARMFGVGGLASGEDFLTRFTTTLGGTIYMPPKVREDPFQFMEVLTHECQHVAQFHKRGFDFSWLYLTEPEVRVKEEADAYAGGISVTAWLLEGFDPNWYTDSVAESLVNSYHVAPQDADLAKQVLKSHFVSVKHGVRMSEAARVAVEWLQAHYPQLKGTL